LQHFQRFYSFGVDVCFTRIWDFTWRVSDCEELVMLNHPYRHHPLNSSQPLSEYIPLSEVDS